MLMVLGFTILLPLLIGGMAPFIGNHSVRLPLTTVLVFAAGLLTLGIGTAICMGAAFAVAGGPDGEFMTQESLLIGAGATLAAVFVTAAGTRLLSLPCRLAGLFALPPLATFGFDLVGAWPITLLIFTLGPEVCLVVVLAAWVMRQLAVGR